MSKGRIKNFTLAGDVLTLTAMVDKLGETCYQLDTSLAFGETLTYEGLIIMLEAVMADIKEVFELGMTFKKDENGELIETEDGALFPDGNGLRNEHIEAFERTWNDAQA